MTPTTVAIQNGTRVNVIVCLCRAQMKHTVCLSSALCSERPLLNNNDKQKQNNNNIMFINHSVT